MDGAEAEARRLAAAETARPFDLEAGPLVRALLVRLAPEDHAAVLTVHHLVTDGWSMGLLVGELGAAYRGRDLPAPPLQLADYAAWQRGWLAGERLEREVAWWRERLVGAPHVLELPADRPRPALQSHRGGSAPVALPPRLRDLAAELSRRRGASLFMTLLASFQAALARHTGQDDLLVGVPVAGRTHRELEESIGFFVNTLALRADLRDDPTFGELLDRTRERTLDAHAHQDLPFEKLVEELGVERDLARTPLFQVMFVLQTAPAAPLDLPGVTAEPFDPGARPEKFDLTVSLADSGGGVAGIFGYAADLFDGTTIRRLAEHWRALLEAALAAPDVPLSRIPSVPAAERHQLLREWNDTAAPPEVGGLAARVLAWARAAPDAVAVAWEDEQVTYGELAARAEGLAHRLRELGAGAESPVAVCLPPGPRWVEAVLGVLEAGGAYVPLDPDHPAERLELLLEDVRPAVLVAVAAAGAGPIEEEPPAWAGPRLLLGPAEPSRPRRRRRSHAAAARGEDRAAYVLYTSGSTGRPKGVCCPDGAVLNLLADFQARQPLGPGDRASFWTSPTFDVSVYEVFSALTAGATLCGVPRERRLDGSDLAAWLAERRIDSAYVPPFHVAALEEAVAAGAGPRLKRLLVGVEPIPEPRLARIARGTPGLVAINGYGPTESTVCCTLYTVDPASSRP
ncbi:MAG TPA: condensation domain-containing protein, partial [Thermoanaerobaculia bacterium]|nr:condensation domain-containing protein [Thermoanaerobaculia bacterium]